MMAAVCMRASPFCFHQALGQTPAADNHAL
jgi:hypothetical protein